MAVQPIIKESDKMNLSELSQIALIKLRVPLVGIKHRIDLSKMGAPTSNLSKNLISKNTTLPTTSHDVAGFRVCGIERKKQRIGVRLTIAERQSLENAAKQNNLTLSSLISQFAQSFAHQKSA